MQYKYTKNKNISISGSNKEQVQNFDDGDENMNLPNIENDMDHNRTFQQICKQLPMFMMMVMMIWITTEISNKIAKLQTIRNS